MIFCLLQHVSTGFYSEYRGLTVTAGLDGGLDVADALDGDAVLVVAVDILVLKLANLVDEHAELVCDIGNIVVTCLSPDGKLLLRGYQCGSGCGCGVARAYSDLHALPGDKLHAAHHVLLHLHQLRKLLRKVGSKCTSRLVAEGVA